jgi:hypothetical protein
MRTTTFKKVGVCSSPQLHTGSTWSPGRSTRSGRDVAWGTHSGVDPYSTQPLQWPWELATTVGGFRRLLSQKRSNAGLRSARIMPPQCWFHICKCIPVPKQRCTSTKMCTCLTRWPLLLTLVALRTGGIKCLPKPLLCSSAQCLCCTHSWEERIMAYLCQL